MIATVFGRIADLFLPERRSESVGYGPLDDFWYGPVGRTVSARVNVNENTALNYSACWAATRLLAGTAGWLPLNLYRREPKGGRGIADDDRRNYCLDISPNNQMVPMLFKSQGVNQQVNWGNAYAEIQWDGRGKLAALWPIHASRVDPLMDKDTGELWYKVRNNNGPPTMFKSYEILHFPSILSDDGILGKGVVRHAREAIGMGLATERYGAAWFGKGGVPRVVIEHPGKMSEQARTNFRSEWKDIYGGPDGEKVALLQEGSKATALNINNDDSQFLETRQFNIEEIARWYGVPPHMIQHLLRATFNNIEQLGIEFVKYSLMPWLVIWEQELSKKLLTPEEQQTMFFRFNVTELLRGDAASRSEYWAKLVTAGIATRNEARIGEDMNPAEGGTTFLVQGAMVALDENGVPLNSTHPDVMDLMSEDDDEEEIDEEGGESDIDDPEEDQEPGFTDSPFQNDGIDNDNDSNTASVLEAVRYVLEDSFDRMVRKEATAARRASNKPGQFHAWLDEFYAKHREQLTEVLGKPTEAAGAMGFACDASALAAEHIEKSKADLLRVSGENTESTFAQAIDALVTDWESHRAAAIASAILERKTQC